MTLFIGIIHDEQEYDPPRFCCPSRTLCVYYLGAHADQPPAVKSGGECCGGDGVQLDERSARHGAGTVFPRRFQAVALGPKQLQYQAEALGPKQEEQRMGPINAKLGSSTTHPHTRPMLTATHYDCSYIDLVGTVLFQSTVSN